MASIKDPEKKKEAQEKYNMYKRKVVDWWMRGATGSEKTIQIKAEKKKTLLGAETEGNQGSDTSGVILVPSVVSP